MKKFLAASLAAAMAFSAFGSLSVSAQTTDDGYTTDSHGIMAYKFLNSSTSGHTIELRGFYSGAWKQTSYRQYGISTYIIHGTKTDDYYASLSVDKYSGDPSSSSDGFVKVDATGNFEDAGSGLYVRINPVFVNDGKQIQLNYEVKNTSADAQVFSLGSASDVQISADDYATITRFDEGNGFKMISTKSADKDPDTGEYAQLNFWGKSTVGVTDVTDFWYGYWKSRNGFNKSNTENEVVGNDSGMSYSWKNMTIAPNKTQTYSVLFGIGGASSHILPAEKYTITVTSTEGGKASSSLVEAVPGQAISLAAVADKNYIFDKWQVLEGNVSISGNNFVMPANDVVIRAEFKKDEGTYVPEYYVGLPYSYIYSYNSSMEKIGINSNRKFVDSASNVSITVKLGSEYAGKNVTLYNGKKSTAVKVDSAVLNSSGRATFSVPMGKNFTLVVE